MENDKKYLELASIKITQPIGDFFITKISAKKLVEISYSDIRALSKEREVETYLGIQRPLNIHRAKEIKEIKEINEYVKNIDASFPSAIILSIDKKIYIETKVNTFFRYFLRMMKALLRF